VVSTAKAVTGPQCDSMPSIVSRWVAKVRSQLHPAYPEEAQLLAELNLPLAAAQAKMAEQAAKQSQAAAQCARETAKREAERAQRDATRMREQMAREANMAAPVSIDLKGLDNLDLRMQTKAAALAERIAARNVRMQIAAAKLQAVSMRMQESGKRKSQCRSRAEMQ